MIMKTVCLFIVAVCFWGCSQAQAQVLTPPEWKITLHVVDEAGLPVPAANVKVGYYVQPPPDQSIAMNSQVGRTDTNGLFSASGRSQYMLSCSADKDGYYAAATNYELGIVFDKARHEPWNPTLTVLLKRIGRPIPMYAKRVETKVQKENEPVGFDLVAGDWVSPYGSGKETDLLFTVHRNIINEREYQAELKLTFSRPGDGIAIAPPQPDGGSNFKTSRTASESGYEAGRLWHFNHAGRTEPVSGYFLRARTVLDEKGNVKSALYGKIRGDIRFYAGTKAPSAGMGFDYYLNPMPNDRNVEFDPKRNLLKGLKSTEKVIEP